MKSQRQLTIVIKLGTLDVGAFLRYMLIPALHIGTSSIVHEQTHEPLLPILSLIVATAVELRKDGHRVVIVSSGAIGVGLRRMDVEKRPKHLPRIQVRGLILVQYQILMEIAGIGSYRAMSAHKSMGQPFCPSSTTRGSGVTDEG